MRKRHALFLLFLFPVWPTAWAQSTAPDTYFSISYFGILGTHPGLKLGFQHPLVRLSKTDQERQLNQLTAGLSLIIYYHRRNHLGLGVQAELGLQNRRFSGLNKEVFFGLGYLRTLIPNELHDFDAAEDGRKRRWMGSSHLLKSVAIGLGRNMTNTAASNFWTIRPTLLHIRPWNTGATLNFALDAGYQFH